MNIETLIDIHSKVDLIDEQFVSPIPSNITEAGAALNIPLTGYYLLILAAADTLRMTDGCTIPRLGDYREAATLTIGGVEMDLKDVIVSNDVGATVDIKNVARLFLTFKSSCIQVLVDLSAADSVTRLDARKVNAYFKSKGSNTDPRDDFILKIRPLFKFVPTLLDSVEGLALLTTNNWMTYRLSYSSTADLILRAYQVMGGRLPSYISAKELKLATDSSLKKHDKSLNDGLSQLLIAKAYVILEAEGILPTNWYQGTRAINAIPVKTLKSLRSLAASFKEICKSEGSAENIDNLEDLNHFATSTGVTDTARKADIMHSTEVISNLVDVPKAYRDSKDILYFIRILKEFVVANKVSILLLFIVVVVIYFK